MNVEPTVVARRHGRIGRLLLNRPGALNALDPEMIATLRDALRAWQDSPDVHAVVIEGAGGRSFCAGGDVRALRAAVLAGDHATVESFFAAEYALNQAIADFTKPYVAIIDGLCLGGGMGLSIHGPVRVATQAAQFAMPETAIALFPDVGATYFLPRLRGQSGMYLALTGTRLQAADAAYVGLATHVTDRETAATLADAMAQDGPAILASIAQPFTAPIASQMAAIDHCFGASDVAGILDRLTALDDDWSRTTLHTLRTMAPAAVLWSFRAVRAGAARTLPQCLAAELALTRAVTRHPDFLEGVRAMLVDKDRMPKWRHARIEDVPPAEIDATFAA